MKVDVAEGKSDALAQLAIAQAALSKVKTLEDATTVIDKMSAAAAYARAKGAFEAYNLALEIKLRAERKAGTFLAEMKAEGELKAGKPKEGNADTLSTLGIAQQESSRWQRIAKIPEKEFEEYLREATNRTQSGLLFLASKYTPSEPVITPDMPKGVFNVVLADPPWEYDFSKSDSRAIENQYPTMETDKICELQPPFADNAILFLWVPAPKVREGLRVMSAWGFEYKTDAVWVKDKIGMGYYFRSKHELLFVGTKGDFSPPLEKDKPISVIESPRTEHSKKPEILYDHIERMYPNGKYLELFARKSKRPNWTAWGIEA
jgi:N6-adenosine-specific RNA methylase IME4